MSAFGQRIAGIGKAMAGVGVGGLAGLGAAVGVFARVGTALEEMHQRTGVSVESLSKLSYAAQSAGVGTDALELGIRKMSRAIYEAGQGSREAIDGLGRLGLNLGALQGLSADQQLGRVADAIDKLPVGDRAGAAFAVLGRGAAELLPLLNRGSAGIDALGRHAADLGLVVSGPAAAAAALLRERLADLGDVAEAAAFKVGGALVPTIGRAIEALTRAGAEAGRWIDAHRGLVIAAGAAAGSLAILGGSLVGVGTALQLAGPAIAIITSGFGVVPVVSAAAAFGIEAVGLAAAAILSPVGLGVAAVVGLGAAFVAAGGMSTGFGVAVRSAAGSAVAYGIGAFERLKAALAATWATVRADALTVFGGIRGAITAGDWALAGRTVMDLLRLEIARGTAGLWDPILKASYVVRGGLLDGWSYTVEGLGTTWSYMKEYLSDWSGVTTAAARAAELIGTRFRELTSYIGNLMASALVKAQADVDVRQQFGNGRVITQGDANLLAAGQTERMMLGYTAATGKKAGDADYDEKLEHDRANNQTAANTLVGTTLTEDEVKRLVEAETRRRLGSMADEQGKSADVADAVHRERVAAIDAKFAAESPDDVAKGEAERKRIADQQSLQRQANDTGLAGILSEVGKGAQKAIDDADAALKADAAKGKTEQAKTEADDTKRATALDELGKSSADSADDPRVGGGTPKFGTFNPLALFGVGGGVNVGERIAKATEKTAENTAGGKSPTPKPTPTAPGTSTSPDVGAAPAIGRQATAQAAVRAAERPGLAAGILPPFTAAVAAALAAVRPHGVPIPGQADRRPDSIALWNADHPALDRARRAASSIPNDRPDDPGRAARSDPKATGKGGHDDRVPAKLDAQTKLLTKIADAVKGGGGLAFT